MHAAMGDSARRRGGAGLAAASGVAAAAPSEAERTARAHFQAGEARFKAGAFDEALAEYQAGYDAKPLPGFLVNIAQCQRRLGDLKTARATYQKFVLVAPDSPLVPQVRSMIAEIDGLLANLDGGKPAARAGTRTRSRRRPNRRRSTRAGNEAPAPVLVATAPGARGRARAGAAAPALVAVGRDRRRGRRRRGHGARPLDGRHHDDP